MKRNFTPAEVVNSIWSRSEGQFVYLPRALNGTWYEGSPQTPGAQIYGPTTGENYFTPLRYNGLRKRALVGKPGVIFADVDQVSEKTLAGLAEVPPSVIIKSSPGHAHVYWYLDEPVEPQLWEPHARGWTHRIDADPGGWDLTQVLRVPGTLNGKYAPKHQVYVQLFAPDRTYALESFGPPMLVSHSVSGDNPAPDKARRDSFLYRANAIGTVPLSAQYWLTVTPAELTVLGKVDRSKILWGLYKQLYEAGFTREEIFQLTFFSAVNKHRDTPSKLWDEIGKAAIS